jgi:hypothetical protein
MGVSGQRHAPAALLPPRKGPPVPIVQEAEWAPEPVWTQAREKKSSAPAGDRTPVVQPVVRYYTAWAASAPDGVWGVEQTHSSYKKVNISVLLVSGKPGSLVWAGRPGDRGSIPSRYKGFFI